MNKQNQNTAKKDGFTIIEVVLVLAIAGLIFLMVFIALPNLQRGQRDSQRKSDLARISTQISNYQSSNRGNIPQTTGSTYLFAGFVQKYLGTDASTTQAGSEYKDPSKGVGYTFTTDTDPSALGVIDYVSGRICGENGASASTFEGSTATNRNYTLRVKLENQSAPYCLDNR